jgi:hypothetical protein
MFSVSPSFLNEAFNLALYCSNKSDLQCLKMYALHRVFCIFQNLQYAVCIQTGTEIKFPNCCLVLFLRPLPIYRHTYKIRPPSSLLLNYFSINSTKYNVSTYFIKFFESVRCYISGHSSLPQQNKTGVPHVNRYQEYNANQIKIAQICLNIVHLARVCLITLLDSITSFMFLFYQHINRFGYAHRR